MNIEEMSSFFSGISTMEWGEYGYQTLFFAALLMIFMLEKMQERRNVFIWYPVIILLAIYNPITQWLCRKIFEEKVLAAYYCRLFLMMPITIIIAYGLTLMIQRCAKKCKKFLLVFCVIIVVVLSGHAIYVEDWYVKAQNVNKVPNDALQVCALVGGKDEVKIIVPDKILVYIRQIDASIKMPYGRYSIGSTIDSYVSSDNPRVDKIFQYALENDCDYVVCLNREEIIEKFNDYGCSVYGYTDNYVVIKINDGQENTLENVG